MIPTPDTMLLARINKTPNTRGIAPYNKYFERSKTNALCLEFHNPDITPMLRGMKELGFKGAITVAFEQDIDRLSALLDAVDPVAKRVGVIGFVALRDGKYTGYAQGSFGLYKALLSHTSLNGKNITICGAGHMAKGLLIQLELNGLSDVEVSVFNRTPEKAAALQKEFSVVKSVGSLADLQNSSGDILINLTDIGTPWAKGESYTFSKDLVSRYTLVADSTFVPFESPLIQTAKAAGKDVSPGWETFCYGTEYIFRTMLGIEVDTDILGEELRNDFRTNRS